MVPNTRHPSWPSTATQKKSSDIDTYFRHTVLILSLCTVLKYKYSIDTNKYIWRRTVHIHIWRVNTHTLGIVHWSLQDAVLPAVLDLYPTCTKLCMYPTCAGKIPVLTCTFTICSQLYRYITGTLICSNILPIINCSDRISVPVSYLYWLGSWGCPHSGRTACCSQN